MEITFSTGELGSALLALCLPNADKAQRTKIALVLIRGGAGLEWRSLTLKTALYMAVVTNLPGMAYLLIEHGANIEARDNDGMTPLLYAVSSEDIYVAMCLLEFGADIEARNNDGKSALFYPGSCGNLNLIALLLKFVQRSKLAIAMFRLICSALYYSDIWL